MKTILPVWPIAFGLILIGCTVWAEVPERATQPASEPMEIRKTVDEPETAPYRARTISKLVLRDEVRQKDLQVRVWYPAGDGPFPAIIFSHGMFGSKDGYEPLVRLWAEHGFVCILPTHADSVSLRREQGEKIDRGALFREMGPMKGWEERQEDMKFLLDSLPDLAALRPALAGKIDLERIGVGGHSFGAFTSQLAAGATITATGQTEARSFSDPRPLCFLLLSPQGPSPPGLTEDSWGGCTRPMMFVTGTKDKGRGGRSAEWRLEPFRRCPPGEKFLVFIEGADHGLGGVSGGTHRTWWREPNEAHLKVVQAASLAFWKTYLKNDAQACEHLAAGGLDSVSTATVTVSAR